MALERLQVVVALQRAERRLLETPLAPRSLIVESLPGSGTWFAAVDSDGYWSLVITARTSGRPVPVLKLSLLSADYGKNYELHGDATVEVLRVCAVRCTSLDPAVRSLFASFCVALLEELPEDPSDSDVERQVSKWVALFWRLQAPARTTVIGLIGELTLLDRVEHVGDWIRAWHSDATDNLDFAFSAPPLSVEVKATTSQQRVHDVSIHQASPTIGHQHYFASVIVELREAGVRVGDVVDEIAGHVANAPEAELFWRSLASVCGSSLGEFFEFRFMRDVARNSLRLYTADSVPQPVIVSPIPAGVSAIRFRSDFSSVEPTNPMPILGFAAKL